MSNEDVVFQQIRRSAGPATVPRCALAGVFLGFCVLHLTDVVAIQAAGGIAALGCGAAAIGFYIRAAYRSRHVPAEVSLGEVIHTQRLVLWLFLIPSREDSMMAKAASLLVIVAILLFFGTRA